MMQLLNLGRIQRILLNVTRVHILQCCTFIMRLECITALLVTLRLKIGLCRPSYPVVPALQCRPCGSTGRTRPLRCPDVACCVLHTAVHGNPHPASPAIQTHGRPGRRQWLPETQAMTQSVLRLTTSTVGSHSHAFLHDMKHAQFTSPCNVIQLNANHVVCHDNPDSLHSADAWALSRTGYVEIHGHLNLYGWGALSHLMSDE